MPITRVLIPHRIASLLLLGLVILSSQQPPALGEPSFGEDRHEKPYALIFTTVWGPDNRPVYGVKVKLRPADQKKAKWEGFSDHQGEFAQRVPAGKADYVVWAEVKGYKLPDGRHLQPGNEVTVHIENDERADVGLHLK
jgi:hypothetical protein